MITANDPAMPTIKTSRQQITLNKQTHMFGDTHSAGGLTIRQYFAIEALAALLSNSAIDFVDDKVYAMKAKYLADALIEELNKE